MDYAALKSEITTDPKALGYAPLINVSDNGIAGLLNSLTGLGAETINLLTQTKGAILRGIIPALDQLASGLTLSNSPITSQTAQKWANRFSALRSGDGVLALDANFMGLLGQMVTDGLITQPAIDAFTTRTGSRAEVLWGAGTVIQPDYVAKALGR